MTLSIGDNIGAYRITEQLGQGGMATVFKAYHAALDRYVAIKVMHAELSASETILHRMRIGARAAARLHHPNIQLIYYMGRDPVSQLDFVVM